MKLSETPTEYLFLKAKTNSDWDSCDYAVLQINNEWTELLQQRLAELETFKKYDNFSGISFSECTDGFFTYPLDEEYDSNFDVIRDNVDCWCFVTLDNDELENLPQPESTITAELLHMNLDGSIWFTATGKHTGEEFWTSAFDLTELLKKLKP
jgi:hypothetical protein